MGDYTTDILEEMMDERRKTKDAKESVSVILVSRSERSS